VARGTGCSLTEWVVNAEGVNKFKGNFDHYLSENRVFKLNKRISIGLNLSSLELFALIYMLYDAHCDGSR